MADDVKVYSPEPIRLTEVGDEESVDQVYARREAVSVALELIRAATSGGGELSLVRTLGHVSEFADQIEAAVRRSS